MKPTRYWIHGPECSGKTELAKRISGMDTSEFICGRDVTSAGLRRVLSQSRIVVIDGYQMGDGSDNVLMFAGLNQSMPIGKSGGSEPIAKVAFDIDTLVVISEEPPSDSALASRFFVVAMKGTDRLVQLSTDH